MTGPSNSPLPQGATPAVTEERIRRRWAQQGFMASDSQWARDLAEAALEALLPSPDPGFDDPIDMDEVERIETALTMFIFPGICVPRREMAIAALRALGHKGDPRIGIEKHVVRTESPDAA